MAIPSRLDNKLVQLNNMLEHVSVKHLQQGDITPANLHKALLYLWDKSARAENKHRDQYTELRRCIADVLLLIDGFDIHDTTRLENREFGTKQSLSIAAEKSM